MINGTRYELGTMCLVKDIPQDLVIYFEKIDTTEPSDPEAENCEYIVTQKDLEGNVIGADHKQQTIPYQDAIYLEEVPEACAVLYDRGI